MTNTTTTASRASGAEKSVASSTSPARSLDPAALLAAMRAVGITHVITVPDTHQRTLLALLAQTDDPKLITVCTEDEAIGINAGLYIGGARPMLLIQNNGLYACLNTLKAIPLDARVPTFMLIGEHGRDVALPSRENPDLSVRMLEPTLELWKVPFFRLENEMDLSNFERGYKRCLDQGGPLAVLVAAPTGAAASQTNRMEGRT
ncbi:MAG: thiamine pyrophosphate-binding protein [Steroidobacteraceae bacterium]